MKFCWPINHDGKDEEIEEKNHEEFNTVGSEVVFEDLVEAWPIYAVTIIISLFMTYLFFVSLESCALFMIKLMVGLFTVMMASLGGLLLLTYFKVQGQENVQPDEAMGPLIGAIVVFVILAIFLCLIFCSWRRVKFAAAIIQATADYVTDIKRIFFIPFMMFIVSTTFIAIWSWTGLHLFTTGELYHDPSVPFGRIKWTTLTK